MEGVLMFVVFFGIIVIEFDIFRRAFYETKGQK